MFVCQPTPTEAAAAATAAVAGKHLPKGGSGYGRQEVGGNACSQSVSRRRRRRMAIFHYPRLIRLTLRRGLNPGLGPGTWNLGVLCCLRCCQPAYAVGRFLFTFVLAFEACNEHPSQTRLSNCLATLSTAWL